MTFDKDQLAQELDAVALGHAFNAEVLRVAKDVPGLDEEDHAVLDRYLTGAQDNTDHVRLQEVAIKVRDIHITSYYADRARGVHANRAR